MVLAKTALRGYGSRHQKLRKRWAPIVAAGLARCWRCRMPILPGSPWELGHDDYDRTIWRGPEHKACNRGARKVRRYRGKRAVITSQVIADRW
jgi:hypothetical protein